ncbi:hypothetical protein H0H92_006362 [Tricholoma furcatifolium]|nr:hypothetical protein H0H92_010151 [Tricholoma furcatifolium]KAG6807035.1 hypothetical protein H0H92_009053 [Tricholoma furcatifolium]KAG6809954.1 hypothetical protein H0H92_013919 [Tricholoma furcatifolium]KAG6823865.1 hypothetical protein H0H92_008817 [Tricholoma furcatifolium]KAG6824609.1 hypothetical protein H0H92_006362 [Tricholoma furcatifolium]
MLHEHAEMMTDLRQLKNRLKELQSTIRRKENVLGVDDRAKLQALVNSPYIATMVNALAVKQRLRDKLRSRKFELDRVERSFRKQVNDQKVDDHTEASVQRRDPSISKLAVTYNKLQVKLVDMIRKGVAPRGAIAPQQIETKGIFTLDVDDAIWQDVGLTEDVSSMDLTPPPWLADESVRSGIRAVLELDRCMEEIERLRHECQSLRLWFSEEWEVVNNVIKSALTAEFEYYVSLHREQLLRSCIKWQDSMSTLFPEDEDLYCAWGPSEEELATGRTLKIVEVGSHPDVDDDDDDEEDEGFEHDDLVLIDTLDAVGLADAFRMNHVEEYILE